MRAIARYLEAIDGEKAADNALLEAGAEDDDVVFFIHIGCLAMDQSTDRDWIQLPRFVIAENED